MRVEPDPQPVLAGRIYARRGWPVFPCHTPKPGDGGCSCGLADCGSPGKHPRVRNGLHAATTDLAQIRRWWQRWPRANVGVRTGAPSGLVVIDIDPAHGGRVTLARLVDEHGPFHQGTRSVRTGGGGWHHYFVHPGQPVRNDAGRKLGPGIDIRGDGGYVLAPPSLHASGRRYTLQRPAGEIAELPKWLSVLLTAEPERPEFPRWTPGDRPPIPWGEAALAGELAELQRATEGSRNFTLNRVAFRLGQIVAAGGLDQTRVRATLIQGGQAIGLGERETVLTVDSGLRAGQRSPRGPAAVRHDDGLEASA